MDGFYNFFHPVCQCAYFAGIIILSAGGVIVNEFELNHHKTDVWDSCKNPDKEYICRNWPSLLLQSRSTCFIFVFSNCHDRKKEQKMLLDEKLHHVVTDSKRTFQMCWWSGYYMTIFSWFSCFYFWSGLLSKYMSCNTCELIGFGDLAHFDLECFLEADWLMASITAGLLFTPATTRPFNKSLNKIHLFSPWVHMNSENPPHYLKHSKVQLRSLKAQRWYALWTQGAEPRAERSTHEYKLHPSSVLVAGRQKI